MKVPTGAARAALLFALVLIVTACASRPEPAAEPAPQLRGFLAD